MKFKKGDKVVFIGNTKKIKAGAIGVVTDLYHSHGVEVEFENDWWYGSDRYLKLYVELTEEQAEENRSLWDSADDNE
jgi:hypothetical protein